MEVQVNTLNQKIKFLNDYWREFYREGRFSPYTGQKSNNVICIKEGKTKIRIPLITKLKGDGVSGSQTLDGQEENLDNYALELTPSFIRNGVRMNKEENEKTDIDLWKASKENLMDWSKEKVKNDTIQAMNGIYNGTVYANYGDATGAQLDTWLTNNSDRILYGAARSNTTSGNHTTSLTTIDTTNDKLTTATASLAKRLAQQAKPKIRPLKVGKKNTETFVMFCDPYAFRDIATDSVMTQANRDARTRGLDNPLFLGGDLIWDNIIFVEVPEIADFIDGDSGTNGLWGGQAAADGLNTAGATSNRVGVNFLCGQQAISYGSGQKPQMKVDRTKDYGFRPGVATEFKHDIKKSYFNNKQHGMVTIFTSSARDA